MNEGNVKRIVDQHPNNNIVFEFEYPMPSVIERINCLQLWQGGGGIELAMVNWEKDKNCIYPNYSDIWNHSAIDWSMFCKEYMMWKGLTLMSLQNQQNAYWFLMYYVDVDASECFLMVLLH